MENISVSFSTTCYGVEGNPITDATRAAAAFTAAARVHGTTPEAALIATKEKPAADARKAALATLAKEGYTYRRISEITGSSIRSVGRAVATHHEICTIDAAYRAKWHQIVAEVKAVTMTMAAIDKPPANTHKAD